jgi:DNA-binding HxlR family transcriptional regulator
MDPGTLLIMRDVLHGLTHFEQLQESLGIPPTTLARRLTALVEAGLLERRRAFYDWLAKRRDTDRRHRECRA